MTKTTSHTYHTPKMKRCLDDLEADGADPGKSHAVCYSSIQGAGHKANKSLHELVADEVEKAGSRSEAVRRAWVTRRANRGGQGKPEDWNKLVGRLNPDNADNDWDNLRRKVQPAQTGGKPTGFSAPDRSQWAKFSAAAKKDALDAIRKSYE